MSVTVTVTAEQVQSFFDANPKIEQIMIAIGMTGPPQSRCTPRSTPPAPSSGLPTGGR